MMMLKVGSYERDEKYYYFLLKVLNLSRREFCGSRLNFKKLRES